MGERQNDGSTEQKRGPRAFVSVLTGGRSESGPDARAAAGGGARGSSRAGKVRRRRATATSHSDLGERFIAGVPARIMRPRLVFLSCLIAVCAFGLLMVYSASAVEALKEQGSSWYFLFRQAIFMGMGFAFILFFCKARALLPMTHIRAFWSWGAWVVILGLLGLVLVIGAGGESWGASRWIPLGFFNLQPAEFAKPAIILVASKIFADYYEDRSIDTHAFLFQLIACVAVPAALIMAEPDMGTTAIIMVTVFLMAYLCGISKWVVVGVIAVGTVGFVFFTVTSQYRLERFMTFLDPWRDPYDTGYQATLAIMAFASGGVFGRGIGNATMKYHYLPEAHNDYILAIIGEELGFVGTLLFVTVFLTMIGAGLYIARRSPNLYGRLIAGGCSLALVLQFVINAFGILGVIPMTGKPMPFVSYGGSSVLTSLILAALILRVSIESNVETEADRRRSGLAVMGEGVPRGGAARAADESSSHLGRSTAGAARPRSARSGGGFSVLDGGLSEGGAGQGGRAGRSGRSGRGGSGRDDRLGRGGSGRGQSGSGRAGRSDTGRGSRGSGRAARSGRSGYEGGYDRIDLGSGAQDRLRPRGVRVDYHDITGPGRPRRSGDAGRSSRGGHSGGNRYDR